MSQPDLTGLEEIHALLGRGTEFEGTLTFRGRVRIDGHFRGDIYSEDILILGADARVEGKVEVGTLIVRGGVVEGRVQAQQLVEIHAPGRVVGDIVAPQVFIDRGVVFDGRCVMSEGVELRDLETEEVRERPEAPVDEQGSHGEPVDVAETESPVERDPEMAAAVDDAVGG